MSTAYTAVNSEAAYITGDLYLPDDVNSTVSNAELAWANAIAAMHGPVITGADWTELPATPRVSGGFVWGLITNTVGSVAEPITVTGNGDSSLAASTGLPTNSLEVAHNDIEGRWFALRSGSSTQTRYVSAADSMASFSSHTETTSIVAYDVLHNGRAVASNGCYVMVGTVSGPIGGVVTSSGSAEIYTGSNANTTALTSVARNTTGNIVAVGIGGTSYSTNYGVGWTHTTLPALPGAAIGTLTVSWAPNLTAFVCSGILSTGEMFWATSTTGASWSAWATTGQVVIDPVHCGTPGRMSIGVCEVGRTLVAPYVAGTADVPLVGALISVTDGATWRAVPGDVAFTNLSRLRALTYGNRAAIVSRGTIAISGAVITDDRVNST